MKRLNWIADTYAQRPAGKTGECFYCHVKLGEQHDAECPVRTRTVVVEIKATLIVTVPEHWDADSVEFWMNEGSSCCDNLLTRADEQSGRMGCSCSFVEGKFVREATAEDEETYKLKIADAEA